MNHEIDWMGRWYTILKERGENDRPTLGQLNLKTGAIDWLEFSHADMDGIGAFEKYYRERGTPLTHLPQIREKKKPSFIERLQIIYRLLFKTEKLKTIWRENNKDAAPRDPLHVHWKIFSPEDVEQMEVFCKKSGFSINAYFMNIVSKVLLKELSLNEEGTWTLPVNLRPLVLQSNYNANHSSGILIPIAKSDEIYDTHKRISKCLKEKQHWGIWWVHQIGRVVGMRGMRFISRQNSKKSFLMGSFSILGTWDLPEDHIWIGAAPGSKNFPISAFLMKAHGHLSFCLKIHPYILKDESKGPALFEKVISELLNRKRPCT